MSYKRTMIIFCTFLLTIIGIGVTWNILNPSTRYQKQVPILVEPEEPTADDPTSFNTLILGIDSWEQESARTDLIMLANINTSSKQVRIISIPRDTRVQIPGVGWTKINHAHMIAEATRGNIAGTQATLQAVSNLLQCTINYYVKIDFEGFEHFVDTIGGLPMNLPKSVKLSHLDLLLPSGEQNLNGRLARELVRERYSLSDGDFGRQKLHLMVLKALVHKLLSPENITKLPGLITQVKGDLLDTNFTESDFLSFAWLLRGMQGDDIIYSQLPGKSGYDYDPLVKVKVYYWYPNLDSLHEISEKYFN